MEHLYYNAVQRTSGRDPNKGVTMPVCGNALAEDGQCLEASWRYLEAIGDVNKWSPPAIVDPVFRRHSVSEAGSLGGIIEELDAERPIVIALLLGERFYIPDAEARVDAGPNDLDTAYHAVLAVGYGHEDAITYILIRNSWGVEWGLEGHSWVSLNYLRSRLYAIARFPLAETV